MNSESSRRAATVVFIHGAGSDHTVWRYQSRRLKRLGFDVICEDLPGHGVNPEGALQSIEAYAGWIEGRIGGPAILVGHSMGSLVALAAAPNAGVEGLVLVGTSPEMAVHPALLDAARSDVGYAAELIAGWSMPGVFRGGHPEPGTWQAGATASLVERSRPGVLALDLEACAAFDGAGAAAGVAVPTLVVVGSEDRMTPPRGAVSLSGRIEGADLVVMEGCGHEPMLQAPRQFNRHLEQWLSYGDHAESR